MRVVLALVLLTATVSSPSVSLRAGAAIDGVVQEVVRRHPDGRLESREFYVNGEKAGHHEAWWPNGRMRRSAYYADGEHTGPNGFVNESYTVTCTAADGTLLETNHITVDKGQTTNVSLCTQGGVGGVSYLAYVVPGVLVTTAFQIAVGESTYPVLGGFKWHRCYHAMRATPVQPSHMVGGHLLFLAFRAEIATICVDQTEFVVNKLKDRGTHQAFGVVTNAQDFMRLLQLELMGRI